MNNVTLEKFENWLRNKNLREPTIEYYIYYFCKFPLSNGFNQESVNQFLSKKENRNNKCRSFLNNLKRFLIINHKELEISKDLRMDIMEVELPKLTGRSKTRIIRPIPHEEIYLLEKCLDDE